MTALSWAALALIVLIGWPVLVVPAQWLATGGGSFGHLVRTVLPGYALNSALLALCVGLGTVLIGTATGWLVALCRFPGRRTLEWALVLPLALPAYVTAYALTDFLQVSGPVQTWLRDLTGLTARQMWFPNIRSLPGAVVVLTLALYPYVYLAARLAFRAQGERIVEAGRTLGATPGQAFRRLALPLARPAIAAGAALAMMEALADFGAVSYFGVATFTTGIYRTWFSMGDAVGAARLASLLLLAVALLVYGEQRARSRARYFGRSSAVAPATRLTLAGWHAALALLVCALPVLLGFAVPVAILGAVALDAGAVPDARYWAMTGNTLTVAAAAAVLAMGVALTVAYAVRLDGHRRVRAGMRIAGMGYAVPGSIIAVGVLIPLTALDGALDDVAGRWFGLDLGLVFTGTAAALVAAYVVRFLALALNTVNAGLEKVSPAMDAAAHSLGAGRGRLIARVHAPLLRGSVLTGVMLVFVETVKELPATLILRPFNFDTLAVEAHNLAADERLGEAALPALTIALLGLLPVWALTRTMTAGDRTAAPVPVQPRRVLMPSMRRVSLPAGLVVATLAGVLLVLAAGPRVHAQASAPAREVNVYSARHYPTDEQLYKGFEAATGIRVNRLEGSSDALIARIAREGDNSPADILMTVDAGRLWRAEQAGLFAPTEVPALDERIPAHLRHPDGLWYGFSTRARMIFLRKGAGLEGRVTRYEDLAEPFLEDRVCIRSSGNIYNLSLLASMVAHQGTEAAEAWAQGVADNFARRPQGGDTDQIRAVAAGACDVAVANSYYFARLMASDDAQDQAVVEAVLPVFPNQDGRGTHVNVSGAGVIKTAPHPQAAVAFLTYLASDGAQAIFARGNNEYPAARGAEQAPVLDRLGAFKADQLNVSALGRHQADAQRIFDRVGWP
ncbi:extracellular solute-binding protein [Rhodothalassium salexigens]|nr:extracellular solute-binding protein [Rhodothalassium salexigens]MBB4211713.1 ABC-type Fe3+ transport system permease subunit/ABC-type Fe3+ transport system substrate-binding protein [Rhodothalassium salexigens DSM 2132]